ncbi:SPO11-like protein [Lachancea thermotolerans]
MGVQANVKLRESLHDFIQGKQASTRRQLTEALTPCVREIRLTKPDNSEELSSEISTLLSLMKNAIEQHREPLNVVLGLCGKQVKQPMRFPFYGFERVTGVSADKTAILISLMKRVQRQLDLKETCTIRDVFYLNVELYKNQRTVTEWLNAISEAFELPHRDMLRVVAAQKGLCFTPIDLHHGNSMIMKRQKSLIPFMDANTSFTGIWSEIDRVVVLEKDAVFNTLVDNILVSANALIVTGKGYPDWRTRHFLDKLMLSCPPSVVFEVYTDSDPYGIDIALKYIQNCEKSVEKCPRLCYKGVLIQELLHDRLSTRGLQLLNLKIRDVNFAMKLLQRTAELELSGKNKRMLTQELQRQLFYSKKAEMNSVSNSDFASYFSKKNK